MAYVPPSGDAIHLTVSTSTGYAAPAGNALHLTVGGDALTELHAQGATTFNDFLTHGTIADAAVGVSTFTAYLSKGAATNIPTSGFTLFDAYLGGGRCGAKGETVFNDFSGSGAGTSALLARGAVLFDDYLTQGAATLDSLARGTTIFNDYLGNGRCGARGSTSFGAYLGAGTAILDRLARGGTLFDDYIAAGSAQADLLARGYSLFDDYFVPPRARGTTLFAAYLAHGTAHIEVAPAYIGYCVNIKTGAVSRYTSYPMLRVFRFQGRYFGIKANGNLVELVGDTDDGDPIPWIARTGFLPDQGVLTRLTEAIFDGSAAGDATVRVVRNGELVSPDYVLRKVPVYTGMHSARVKFGPGPEARHHQIEIQNQAGAALEVSSLEIHQAPTSKRIT